MAFSEVSTDFSGEAEVKTVFPQTFATVMQLLSGTMNWVRFGHNS